MSDKEQEIINKLFDIVQEYSKKHGLSFILGAGKMMGNNKYFAGDTFHQEKNNDIFYICQVLVKQESIGIAIAAAILQAGKDFAKCMDIASKDIH